MERSAGIVKLFRTAQELARELGVELEESLTGGGSDGNFTAALGVPTLDGLGGVGEGATTEPLGARFEISIDGTPRTYRDDKAIAIEAAEQLKRLRVYQGRR